MKGKATALALAMVMLSAGAPLSGQQASTFNGSVDQDWFNPANWSHGVPASNGNWASLLGTSGGVTANINAPALVGDNSGATSLTVGSGANNRATLNILSTGSLVIDAGGSTLANVRIGSTGSTGTINAAGNLTANGGLYLGDGAGSNSTLNITGGTSSFANVYLSANHATATSKITLSGGNYQSTYISIAHNGIGSWTQTGGNAVISNESVLGNLAGSNGTFELSAGSYKTPIFAFREGTSSFTLSGSGVFTVADWKYTGTSGTYNINLNGGTLHTSGAGKIGFDLTNTATTFAIGEAAGPQRIGVAEMAGTYVQGELGRIAFDLASLASHDKISLTQGAVLEGFLDISLLNGYLPDEGDYWDIMTTSSGVITLDNLTVTDGFTLTLLNNGETLRLGVAAVPEPGSVALLGGAFGLWWLKRRRRSA